MKAFKYLVFLLLTLFSSVSYSALTYQISVSNGVFTDSSKNGVCSKYYNSIVSSVKYSYRVTSANNCRIENQQGSALYTAPIYEVVVSCPSATAKDLKVSVNSKSYVCVEGCQYRLRACVDVDIEPGMTCSAISTGQDCGTTPPPKEPDPNKPDATPDPADPEQEKTNTAQSESISTSTSESTSTSTTNNNTTITNTTTNTTINTTTNTIINLDKLENVIKNMISILSNKLDAILGKMDQNGGSEGSTGNGEATDLTETNQKIDDTKGVLDSIKDWLTGGEDGQNGSGGDNPFGNDLPPEKVIDPQQLQTNIFGTSAACPADRSLSMTLFTGRTFSKTFSFSMWCDKLAIFGYIILLAAYGYAAYIVVSKS